MASNLKTAVLQSSYIPWKGYFDIIHDVDLFIETSLCEVSRHNIDTRRYMVYTVLEDLIMMTTTIQKWGNSQAIRIPKSILEALFLAEYDTVELAVVDNSLVVSKKAGLRRAKKSLEERFENYAGDYKCCEYDWGKKAGMEVW